MKSLNLFLVLLISTTIIYLALINKQNFKYNFNYQEQEKHIENFALDPKTTIANRLGFDSSRLHNYNEVGDATKANEFQVQFEIYPRTINQISEPTIAD
jgi:hypothetical protein